MLVRLANRLKALTMTQYSSDEEEDSDARPSSSGEKKSATFGGTAFAEVVRARMKLKDDIPAETTKTV